MQYTVVAVLMLITNLVLAETSLSWETKSLKNKEWTKITFDVVHKYYNILDTAEDTELFCPQYNLLTDKRKRHFWAEMVAAIAFFESGWKPLAKLTEKNAPIEPVTGKPVTSAGLLQLGYGDKTWAKWCNFLWNPAKEGLMHETSVFNPKNNIECGVGILSNQIRKHRNIVLEKATYWSVLKIRHKHQRIDEIRHMIRDRIPACTNS